MQDKLLDSTALGSAPVPLPVQPPPLKIAICLPTKDTIINKTTMCLLAAHSHAMQSGYNVAVFNLEGSAITGQRNDLVDRCLGFGADYLMWIDSDMVFPRDVISRLHRRGKEIVGATYSRRVPPYDTLGAFELNKDGSAPTEGLCKAAFMPGGMMFVKAEVYKKIPYPWYYETYRNAGDTVSAFIEHLKDSYLVSPTPEVLEAVRGDTFGPWLHAAAEAYQDLQGGRRHMSEDYNFCTKARRYGYSIWCDLDMTYQMGHVGDHVVTSMKPEAKANAA